MLAHVLLIPISAGLVAGTPTTRWGIPPVPGRPTPAEVRTPQERSYPSQKSQGAVTLDLRPRWQDGHLAAGRLLIDISATTHSGDLRQINLRRQVRLVVEGDTLDPQETGSLSGHHAVATVEFQLAKRPGQFIVVIRDVPDQPLRSLTWPEATPRP